MANIFLIAVVLQIGLIVAPGSDFALVLRLVSLKRSGYLTAIGLGVGTLALCVAAALGASALQVIFPRVIGLLRYAGVAWLVWQAVISLRPPGLVARESLKGRHELLLGFLNHVLNVEVVIFYVAVFSQVATVTGSLLPKLLLAVALSLVTMVWFGALSYMVSSLGSRIRVFDSTAFRIFIASMFVLSAIGLVAS